MTTRFTWYAGLADGWLVWEISRAGGRRTVTLTEYGRLLDEADDVAAAVAIASTARVTASTAITGWG